MRSWLRLGTAGYACSVFFQFNYEFCVIFIPKATNLYYQLLAEPHAHVGVCGALHQSIFALHQLQIFVCFQPE